MSRVTYDLFWISKTLTVEIRQRELLNKYLASSAYVRCGDQLFRVRGIKSREFEDNHVSLENLEEFDRRMRISELRDQCNDQKRVYSAHRALRLEEVVVIESIISERYSLHQLDEDSSFRRSPTDRFTQTHINRIEQAVFTQTYLHGGVVKLPEPVPENWNIPNLNREYFVKRTKVNDKITQAFLPTMASESKESSKVVLIAAHGLGGIGKTYLAAEYIFNTAKKYAYRIWFNSESPEQLAREYRRFCSAFRVDVDEKSTDQIVIEKVKIWFSAHPRWLLVYDNAPDDKTLAPFLPKGKGQAIF